MKLTSANMIHRNVDTREYASSFGIPDFLFLELADSEVIPGFLVSQVRKGAIFSSA
jgi:hypothetical protein